MQVHYQVLATYFGSAVLFFRFQEGWSAVDSLYFAVAVLTTVRQARFFCLSLSLYIYM